MFLGLPFLPIRPSGYLLPFPPDWTSWPAFLPMFLLLVGLPVLLRFLLLAPPLVLPVPLLLLLLTLPHLPRLPVLLILPLVSFLLFLLLRLASGYLFMV